MSSRTQASPPRTPDAQRVDLTIALRDGTSLRGRCEITSGEPGRPHDPAALERKYRELAAPLWGAARAEQLRVALMNIDHCADVNQLVDFNP